MALLGSNSGEPMDEKPKPKYDWWWPDVSSAEFAEKAVRQGMWAAIVVAGITALVAAYAAGSGTKVGGFVDAWSFVDAVIFGAIAIGIYRKSRFAAVAGLIMFLLEKALQVQSGMSAGAMFMAVVFALCFAHAVRGTYSLHRLRTQAPAGPVTPSP